MNILKSRVFLSSVFFVVGALSMYGIQRLKNGAAPVKASHLHSVNPLLDQFFNDDFFGRSKDPFEEMRRMRKRMLEDFDQAEGGGLFDSWYKKRFGGVSNEVSQREDDHFLYYDVVVEGLKQDKVNVSISNGQIVISGQSEKKSQEGNTSSYISSSFHRSFPVPSHVDPQKMQMEQEKNKIVIKFPKTVEKHI